MKEVIVICLLLTQFLAAVAQKECPCVKGQIIFSDSTIRRGWIEGLRRLDPHPIPHVLLFEDSIGGQGQKIPAKCWVKIVTDIGATFMASLMEDCADLHTPIDEEHPSLQYYFLEVLVEGQYNLVLNVHRDHNDIYEMHRHGPYFDWSHVMQYGFLKKRQEACVDTNAFKLHYADLLNKDSFSVTKAAYLRQKLLDPAVRWYELAADFNRPDSAFHQAAQDTIAKVTERDSTISIAEQGRPPVPRRRAQIVFGNYSTKDGWIDSLRSNDSLPPSSIMLYYDSVGMGGTRITAQPWVKIYVPGATSFMASLREDCTDILTYVKWPDPHCQYYFLPLVEDGKHCMVKNHHGDHLDTYIMVRDLERMEFYHHLRYRDSSGVLLSMPLQRNPDELMWHLYKRASMSPTWREYFTHRMGLPGVGYSELLKDLNMGILESSKRLQELYRDAVKEYYEDGVDRTRISVFGGASVARGRLSISDLDNFRGVAPIPAVFVGVEACERDRRLDELGARVQVGYSEHLFKNLKFSSFHMGGSLIIGWKHRSRHYAYLGPMARKYWAQWSSAAAKRIALQATDGKMDRRMFNYGLKGGVVNKKSNWEFGFEWTAFSSLTHDNRVRQSGTVGLFAIKHFEWYHDEITAMFNRRRY